MSAVPEAAMPKVILICGKICSGKTRYFEKLRQSQRVVLLSCDEIESGIFHHSLGENHDIVAADIQKYLHGKAVEIVRAGSSVVLDWGFWSRSEREETSRFYKSNDIAYEWHYVDVTDRVWQQNIDSRNRAVLAGESVDYYVDDGLLRKMNSRFEPPGRDEIDVWYINER